MSISASVCGFSRNPQTRPASSIRMMPKPRAACRVTGIAAIVTCGSRLLVRSQHVAIVHPIQLVPGQDQHVFDARLLHVANVLAHGVGRPLIPIGPLVGRLLSRQQFDESARRSCRSDTSSECGDAG